MKGRLPVAWAGDLVEAGGVVVFPTDTLYGIGCRADLPESVDRLLAAKQSPPGRPLPVLAASLEAVEGVVSGECVEVLRRLSAAFWPGALTVVMPLKTEFQAAFARVSSDHEVGFRVPGEALARYLAARAGGFIVGTSANLAGRPPAQEEACLDPALTDVVDCTLTSAKPCLGAPSTVVRFTPEGPVLIRDGAVPFERILEVWRGA